jgi:ABC-type glycerol-3-phosphate transport system substrate-binding protein
MRLTVRRIVPLAALLALTAASLLPRASDAQQPRLGITISAWFIPAANDLFKQIVAEWAKQKNATVDVELVSEGDLTPKFTTAAETGAGPDIMQVASLGTHLFPDSRT